MSDPVQVSILRIEARSVAPGLDISYRVTNHGQSSVWLVQDGWIIFNLDDSRIEVSLARGRMNPASAVFGYFVPATVELPPGVSRDDSLALQWPLELDMLWNSAEVADPPPGRYSFTLRIGYGDTPSPEDPILGDTVESPVFRWQREAVSGPATIDIEKY